MKRFFVTMALCALMAIGATSCKKRAGEELPAASKKGVIHIEKFEGIERGKGLSGNVLLSVSNGLRSDVMLSEGEISVNYGGTKCCALMLTGEVIIPKKVISSVRVPVSLELSSPIAAYGVLTKVIRGELNKVTLTIDAEVKIGVMRRHIYKENISLRDALKSANLSTDMLKGLAK